MGEVRETATTSGHAAEVERVYREDGPRLWRAILAFTADRDLTNEVVAEAFAQCLRRGTEVRSPSRWIWRASFRIAGRQLKERRERSVAPLTTDEQAYDTPEPAAEVLSALATLSTRQRAAIVLRYYLGYTPTEIAGLIGAAPPTVRVHLMRGLRRLRVALEEERHED